MKTLPLTIEIDARHPISAEQIEAVITELSTYTVLGTIDLTSNFVREYQGQTTGYLRLSTSTKVQEDSNGLTNVKGKNLTNRITRAVRIADLDDKAYGWGVTR